MTLLYDPIAGILTIRLLEVMKFSWEKSFFDFNFLQAQDLQPRDFSGTADPYAKIRLLPDKTNMWQTRIHKRTLNPGENYDFN